VDALDKAEEIGARRIKPSADPRGFEQKAHHDVGGGKVLAQEQGPPPNSVSM
jgi:hypothetical protein